MLNPKVTALHKNELPSGFASKCFRVLHFYYSLGTDAARRAFSKNVLVDEVGLHVVIVVGGRSLETPH